ncbi:thioesterase family protein [Salinisphaera sp. SPP-AMP-43]|uniref:acyl-CoA thioesterase n=1 Tax=Salinisphaera sp. SPP-AMP-43 TaxID=3121288 RepID=UPI003C6E0EB9
MNDVAVRTAFSDLLQQLTATGTGYDVAIPPDWLQGRAIYGGLSAALCLAATEAAHTDLPPLRSAQIGFVGPAGARVAIQPTLLRRGKSTAFIAADMSSDGEPAVRSLFCFGANRESALNFRGAVAPSVSAPEQGDRFFEDAQGRNLGPSFAQHFETRRVGGALPMSASPEPEFLVWIRHRDEAVDPGVLGLVALADAIPPAAMASMDGPAPVSSMTWQLDLLTDRPATRDGWWLCRSQAETVGSGYAGQHTTIWNADLEPVIAARQSVAVFA